MVVDGKGFFIVEISTQTDQLHISAFSILGPQTYLIN